MCVMRASVEEYEKDLGTLGTLGIQSRRRVRIGDGSTAEADEVGRVYKED